MKKYKLVLSVLVSAFVFISLLGFNVNSASAANCAPGDLFNSTTGLPCQSENSTTLGSISATPVVCDVAGACFTEVTWQGINGHGSVHIIKPDGTSVASFRGVSNQTAVSCGRILSSQACSFFLKIPGVWDHPELIFNLLDTDDVFDSNARIINRVRIVNPFSATPTPTPVPTTLLTIGSRGAEVSAVQQILKDEGYYSGRIDGRYGPRTARAVREFQEDNDLPVTGNVDAGTLAVLNTFRDVVVMPPPIVTPPPVVSQNPVISGVSGPQTLNINQQGTWTVNASNSNGGNLSYSVLWGDESAIPDMILRAQTLARVQQTATFTHSYSVAGNYAPRFTVTNTGGQSAQTSLSVNVGGVTILTPLVITTPATLFNGRVGILYEAEISASGGNRDYVWQLDSTSQPLPPGLSLSSLDCNNVFPCPRTANISGVLTTAGTFNFTLAVVSSDSNISRVRKQFTLTVQPATTSTNRNPVIQPFVIPTNVIAGQSTNFNFRATDADNDDLMWMVTNWGDGTSSNVAECIPVFSSRNTRLNWNYNPLHTWVNAGRYTVELIATDCRVGGLNVNRSFEVVVGGVTIPTIPTPVISSISPTIIHNGDVVTVTGANFIAPNITNTFVSIDGGSSFPLISLGNSSIGFTLPATSVGVHTIQVVLSGGDFNIRSNAFSFSVLPATATVNCAVTLMNNSTVSVGQNISWAVTSSPVGLRAYLFGTRNGVADTDVNALAGTTNFTQTNQMTQAGSFTRRFVLKDNSGADVCSTNTLNLTVIDPTATPSISVNYPTTGVVLPRGAGNTRTITWSSTTSIPRVIIRLVDALNPSTIRDIATVNNTGQHSWVIPTDVPNGSYFVQVTDANMASTTGRSGTFTFISPVSNFTIRGDANINGTVNIGDVQVTQMHLNGSPFLTGQGLVNADVNRDGVVTARDVTLISQFVSRTITAFPDESLP